jgi:hypothetical protein
MLALMAPDGRVDGRASGACAISEFRRTIFMRLICRTPSHRIILLCRQPPSYKKDLTTCMTSCVFSSSRSTRIRSSWPCGPSKAYPLIYLFSAQRDYLYFL